MPGFLESLLRGALPAAAGYEKGRYLRAVEDEQRREREQEREDRRRRDAAAEVLQQLSIDERRERLKQLQTPEPPEPPAGVDYDYGPISGTAKDVAEAEEIYNTNRPFLEQFEEQEAAGAAPQLTPWQQNQIGRQTTADRHEQIVSDAAIRLMTNTLPIPLAPTPTGLSSYIMDRYKLGHGEAARLALEAWERARRNRDRPGAAAETDPIAQAGSLDELYGEATSGTAPPQPPRARVPRPGAGRSPIDIPTALFTPPDSMAGGRRTLGADTAYIDQLKAEGLTPEQIVARLRAEGRIR